MTTSNDKAGLLRVAPELLRERIGIEPGHRIADARITADGALEFVIVGPSMPHTVDGQPQPVRLLLTKQAAVLGCWEHAADERWPVKG